MKYLKYFESEKIDKIDNLDIINFAKIFNKEKGYSNKAIFYNSNFDSGKYISVAENPVDNFGYIIVGDFQLEKFIRNAKNDGMSNTLYMRALTNKVNKKYGNNNVIIVSIDGNTKIDMSKDKDAYDRVFRPINKGLIEKTMNNSIITEERTLNVNRNGEIITPKQNEDYWQIRYKESEDYIFTNFHSGWNIIMKESDFITKFMKDTEYLLNAQKYNL